MRGRLWPAAAIVPLLLFCVFTFVSQSRMVLLSVRIFEGGHELSTLWTVLGALMIAAHCAALVPVTTLVLCGIRIVARGDAVPSWPRVFALIGNAHVPLVVWTVMMAILAFEVHSPVATPEDYVRLVGLAHATRPLAYVAAGLWLAAALAERCEIAFWRALMAVFLPLAGVATILGFVLGQGIRLMGSWP